MDRILVVGASLAGLRAAETLRANGFDGDLTIIGAEPHPPYSRPPLSKGVLTGSVTVESCALQPATGLDARWVLGQPATALDLSRREVIAAGGSSYRFDGLVIATGSRPRPWAGGTVPSGIAFLRGLDDAVALRDALSRRPRRLLVVGAGFIGSEVVSSAAAMDVAVTLVELGDAPLGGLLGPAVGDFFAELHRSRGVDLRTGTAVQRFLADDRLRGAELTDGTTIEADLALVALGATPNTEWLAGSGLRLDRGVICDATLACIGATGVVAAGDVARWPHPLFGDEPMAIGHWSNAVEQGQAAARTLLAGDAAEPFKTVPTFWSEVHGHKIRSAGLPHLADEAYVVEGSLDDGRFAAVYGRGGTLIGAVTVNMNRKLAGYQRLIEEGEAVGTALQMAAGRPVAAARADVAGAELPRPQRSGGELADEIRSRSNRSYRTSRLALVKRPDVQPEPGPAP